MLLLPMTHSHPLALLLFQLVQGVFLPCMDHRSQQLALAPLVCFLALIATHPSLFASLASAGIEHHKTSKAATATINVHP